MGMVNPETGRIDSLEEREFEKYKKVILILKKTMSSLQRLLLVWRTVIL